ncbi:hypothetical protein BGZ65_011403 [Modicella reniformis]|uniref:Uncharacterized protein n=1 Tax=Modicella reniformis TaxID=1440133 RepID=A0A9P6LVL7_9FUNG|nr:hypothetical protein BGZ65_011403 [Modicella reniformis]
MDIGEVIVAGEHDIEAISKRESKNMVKEDIDAHFVDEDPVESNAKPDRDVNMHAKAKSEDKSEWRGFKSGSDNEESEDEKDNAMDTTVPQNDDTSDPNSDSDSDSVAGDDNGLSIAVNGKDTANGLSKGAKMFVVRDMFEDDEGDEEVEVDDEINVGEKGEDENE